MYYQNRELLFSPSDLITYMESPYASAMECIKLNDDEIKAQMDPPDALLTHLQKKGYEHEDRYSETLIKEGRSVHIIELHDDRSQMKVDTIKAMQEGKDIIVQGYLTLAPFAGSSDFLVKVKGPSNLGDYHYEVWDTKLSKKLKPYFAIQLCCYSEMVAEIQGVMPKKIAVVLGNNKIEHLNIDNYFAYYKTLKNAFLTFHQDEQPTLPDPAESRNYGRLLKNS